MSRIDMLRMVLVDSDGDNPVIFSQGGLTQTFMDIHGLRCPEDVNRLWLERREIFDWRERDPVSGAYSRQDGDDQWQSPLWARDMVLLADGARGFDQVVGHTPVAIPQWEATAHGDSFMLTCTLDDFFITLP